MKPLSVKSYYLIALAVAVLISCSKDSVIEPQTPPMDESQSFKSLRMVLNETYLPVANVDSALAIWEAGGTTQSVKLQAVGNQLTTSLANFTNPGVGKLTVQLFTQLKIDDKPLQWEHRTTYTLNYRQSVVLTGPSGINDPVWRPRAIFHYDNSMGSRFSFLVALRPDDPYFELKGVEPLYGKQIEIVRSFHQKQSGALVFSRGWVCQQSSCLDSKGNLVNREHFLDLAEQLQGLEWNQFRVQASFHLNSTPAAVYEFGLTQDKL